MRGYRATQQPDGTWTIHDVPVMAEVRDGERAKGRSVDRDWLEGAVAKARARADQDGYIAPTHVHHHDDGVPTERAGHLVPRAVRRMPYEGRDRWTLFADMTDIPQVIYDRIRAGDLPYRSVEFEWSTPEVLSLALMPDEVPFFRFGLLRIAEEQPRDPETAPQRLPEQCAPAVAMLTAGTAERALFRFQEGSMPMEQEGTTTIPEQGAPSGFEEKVLEALAAILQAVTGGGQQLADDGDEAPKEEMAEEKDEKEEMACEDKPDAMKAAPDESGQTIAKLSAEVAGLKHRLTLREKREEHAQLASKAKAALKEWPLSESDEADIEKFAAKGKADLDIFVEAYKRNVPKDPPKDFDAFQARAKLEDTEVVMKFAAKGPDQLDAARKASALFRRMRDVPGFKVDEETFINDQVERMHNSANGREEVLR